MLRRAMRILDWISDKIFFWKNEDIKSQLVTFSLVFFAFSLKLNLQPNMNFKI